MIINPPDSSIAFYIFNYPIYYYGLILTFALITGIILSLCIVKKDNSIEYDKFYDSIFYTIIFSIIGARIFYILGDIEYFIKNPTEILMINHGGISIYGAIIFGIISIFVYSKINKTNCLKFLDFYSIVMPLCQAIGRFGNYFNQEAYGIPTDSFIRLYVDYAHRLNAFKNNEYFMPTFLYESIFDILLFITLFIFYKKTYKNKNYKYGTIFFLYLLFYSIIRFVIEQYRIDSILNIQTIPIAQIIALTLIFISTASITILYKKIW